MTPPRPIAYVTIHGHDTVIVAIPCNFDRLRDPYQRDRVHSANRADNAMVKAAGGYLNAYPAKRDVAEDPPGYVFRVTVAGMSGIKTYAQHKARVAAMALAACHSLEADGYDVRESTPESRLDAMVRKGTGRGLPITIHKNGDAK